VVFWFLNLKEGISKKHSELQLDINENGSKKKQYRNVEKSHNWFHSPNANLGQLILKKNRRDNRQKIYLKGPRKGTGFRAAVTKGLLKTWDHVARLELWGLYSLKGSLPLAKRGGKSFHLGQWKEISGRRDHHQTTSILRAIVTLKLLRCSGQKTGAKADFALLRREVQDKESHEVHE